MIQRLLELLNPPLDPEVQAHLREGAHVNSAGFDPWGLNVDTAMKTLQGARWLYDRYFRAEVHGIENVPSGRVLLVPNHGGQVPFDGMLVAMAMSLEGKPPRIVRGMVERWFPSIPFISSLFTSLRANGRRPPQLR